MGWIERKKSLPALLLYKSQGAVGWLYIMDGNNIRGMDIILLE
jgi:hypothetical protein